MNYCIKLIAYVHTSDFILLKLMKIFGGKVKKQRGRIKKTPELEVLQLNNLGQSLSSVTSRVSLNICFNLADLYEVTRCLLKKYLSKHMAATLLPPPHKNAKTTKS